MYEVHEYALKIVMQYRFDRQDFKHKAIYILIIVTSPSR